MTKTVSMPSFSDYAIQHRRIKSVFFEQVNKFVNWNLVEKEINKFYKKGQSVDGRPSYSGLVLFKLTLLQTWYGLSDYEVEAQANDSISFTKFLGLRLEDSIPDHSVISRFRTAMSTKNAYEKIFQLINKQLEAHNVLVRTGAIVDATITDSPRKPKGTKVIEVVEDRAETNEAGQCLLKEENKIEGSVKLADAVDKEAGWIKKGKRLRYGYKKHVCTDEEGMVLHVVTTAANESDMNHLLDTLDEAQLTKRARVKTDKGYASQANRTGLKDKNLKSGIMHKAQRNQPLTVWQVKFNKAISKTRYKIERTHGSIKSWFKTGWCRYVGRQKTHNQHVLESLAYNLYRAPNLVFEVACR
jgi:transposase, IS5 family